MRKQTTQTLDKLGADILVPGVVSRIDDKIRESYEEIQSLLDLRRAAARLQRDTTPLPAIALLFERSDESKSRPAELVQPEIKQAGLTVSGLIAAYQTHDGSPWKNIRHKSRNNYEYLLRRLNEEIGREFIRNIDAKRLAELYDQWTATGRLSMAQSLSRMLSGLASFGHKVLQDKDCRELSILWNEVPHPRAEKTETQPLTEHDAELIITEAHKQKKYSVALAQAFQIDFPELGQKNVIGEWVPLGEPGESKIKIGNQKWLHGLLWSEIDQERMLKHPDSRTGKLIKCRLSDGKHVMRELERYEQLPTHGPVIIHEGPQLPYKAMTFRYIWRRVADAAGVPKTVKNMDARFVKQAIEGGEE
jgi:hypothetical protein